METSDILSPACLRLRIGRTLRLLSTNLNHVRSAPLADTRANKAATDIAQLCWGLNRCGFEEEGGSQEAPVLLEAAEKRLRSESVISSLLSKPSYVSTISLGPTFLDAIARPDTRFEKPFAPLMSSEDAYAFTHSAFYATDFGRTQPAQDAKSRDVWDVVDAGITWSLVRRDCDLLAEFLLAAVYYRMPPSPAFRVGLCALMLLWDDRGLLPGTPGDSRVDAKDLFFRHCHANAVGALLCGELLVRGFTLSQQAPHAVVDRHPACEVLGTSFGSSIADRIAERVGNAALAAWYPELLVFHGLVIEDRNSVKLGIRLGNDTWALSCAAEWLRMREAIEAAAQEYDAPGYEDPKTLAEACELNTGS